jgi:hypothetical protein
METNDSINTTIFSAFLKCPRKAHFLSIAEPKTETYFSELEARISSAYKTRALRTLRGERERAKPASVPFR